MNAQLASMLVPQQSQQQIHTTKVNGRPGAEAFNMPANSDTILVDTTAPMMWFAQTDGAGYKTLAPYDITPHKEVKPEDQYKTLEERITKLEEALHAKSNNADASWKQQQRNDAGNRSNAQG